MNSNIVIDYKYVNGGGNMIRIGIEIEVVVYVVISIYGCGLLGYG